jgi:20S proteasome subunit beta 3
MSSLTSHVLYARKNAPYYVEPIVVGLMEGRSDELLRTEASQEHAATYRPYVCSMDCIGAQSISDSFACSGAATRSLYGTAEALWRPNLSPDELVQVCAKAFTSALERDCLSGYGAMIYLITANGVTEYDLTSRSD